ncbi:MAG: pilin [Planctomycetota bacterium]
MKKNRKGFTLIELLIVVVIVGILALAAIPLITENARDARRAEGEAVAGTIKTQLRGIYAKTGSVPTSTTTGVSGILSKAVGEYVANATLSGSTITVNMQSTTDGVLTSVFNYDTGDASFAWAP